MPHGVTVVEVPDADLEKLDGKTPSYVKSAIAKVQWAIEMAAAVVDGQRAVEAATGIANPIEPPESPQNAT